MEDDKGKKEKKKNQQMPKLNKDELEDAYKRLEVNQKDYDMAYTEAKNLMKQLEKNIDKLNIFTHKYLKEMIGDDT